MKKKITSKTSYKLVVEITLERAGLTKIFLIIIYWIYKDTMQIIKIVKKS